MSTPIHKRKFHAFISRVHANKGAVDQIESWLTDKAGLPIWYEARFLESSEKISPELAKAIEQCRSGIILLSKDSVESGWAKQVFEACVSQKSQTRGAFRIIPIRVEECDVPDFLRSSKLIDISKSGFDLEAASELLLGLQSFDIDPQTGSNLDIYVSRPWHEISGDELLLADTVCEIAMQLGFRLIGDLRDQKGFDEGERVRDIVSSCGGLLAVLPDRGGGKTSKYMLQEVGFASELDLPYVIVAHETVEIPEILSTKAIEVMHLNKNNLKDRTHLEQFLNSVLSSLKEQWKTPPVPHYIFYGTNLKLEHKKRSRIVRRLIQTVSGMPCLMGEEIRRGHIQKEIANRITGALMMIADISEDNLNTCVEAGIALGANIPLHLVAGGPRHKPPFMFRDQQVWHYENDVDLLGIIHKLVQPYRRPIINHEIQTRSNH